MVLDDAFKEHALTRDGITKMFKTRHHRFGDRKLEKFNPLKRFQDKFEIFNADHDNYDLEFMKNLSSKKEARKLQKI